MLVTAASTLTGGTLLKLVVAAFVAGVGVTIAFSTLIYCAERASELRRGTRGRQAVAFQLAAVLAFAVCLAIVALGLLEAVRKPA
ncbi:MAG: hypothetical protein ACRDL8_01395 [Solirubrobacteraceae bacterium]